MLPEVAEQEAVCGNPTAGLEHRECALNKVWRWRWSSGQPGQSDAERFGSSAEAAQPELTLLIRRRSGQGGVERLGVKQSRDQKQGDDADAGAQVGQGELRQQGDGALASLAQVAAYADRSVEGGGFEDGAGVESMSQEPVLGLALRAVVGAIPVCIGELFQVLLHGALEWV